MTTNRSIAVLLWLELCLLAIFALVEVYPGYVYSLGISLLTFEIAIGILFLVLASVVFILLLLPTKRKRKKRFQLMYQVLDKEDRILTEIRDLKRKLDPER